MEMRHYWVLTYHGYEGRNDVKICINIKELKKMCAECELR
jgi:hypothetical protein